MPILKNHNFGINFISAIAALGPITARGEEVLGLLVKHAGCLGAIMALPLLAGGLWAN